MRPQVSAPSLILVCLAASALAGCDSCSGSRGPSAEEREQLLVSAFAEPTPAPSVAKASGIGHAVNVVPGQGPPRIEFEGPRAQLMFPIMAGEGIGPIRFGATKATVERLMGAPCDDSSETLCRYVGRAVELELTSGVVSKIRVSRKGREAKRNADGAIVEYGFYAGAILPDLYFGMLPEAIQQYLGPPQKVETITPVGPDGFSQRHVYDGMTLEYDAWSNGKLVLGAVVLTKSETAAAKNAKDEAERVQRAEALASARAAAAPKAAHSGKPLPQRAPR